MCVYIYNNIFRNLVENLPVDGGERGMHICNSTFGNWKLTAEMYGVATMCRLLEIIGLFCRI